MTATNLLDLPTARHKKRPWWRREERFTRDQIEAHLAYDLVHWLPFGGEAGTEENRKRAAAQAARIIVGRL